MTHTAPNRLVRMDTAAEWLDVDPKTIRRMVSKGTLHGYRVGGRLLRVDMAEVEALARPIPAASA